jgi:hypothetical protein
MENWRAFPDTLLNIYLYITLPMTEIYEYIFSLPIHIRLNHIVLISNTDSDMPAKVYINRDL